jgi:hypothetical protein
LKLQINLAKKRIILPTFFCCTSFGSHIFHSFLTTNARMYTVVARWQTTKIPIWVIFRVFQWKVLVNFTAIWSILYYHLHFGIHFVVILVHFFPFWYTVPKKSGNPDVHTPILPTYKCLCRALF